MGVVDHGTHATGNTLGGRQRARAETWQCSIINVGKGNQGTYTRGSNNRSMRARSGVESSGVERLVVRQREGAEWW